MQLLNKTDMAITVPLLGDAGNAESITLQPNGRVSLPAGLKLAREMSQVHVIEDQPEEKPTKAKPNTTVEE